MLYETAIHEMPIFMQNSKLSCVELLGARSLNILFPLCIVRAPMAAYNVYPIAKSKFASHASY